jgi:hypothetical protein
MGQIDDFLTNFLQNYRWKNTIWPRRAQSKFLNRNFDKIFNFLTDSEAF